MPGPLFAVIGIIVMFLVMRWVFKNGGCGCMPRRPAPGPGEKRLEEFSARRKEEDR